MQFNFFWLRDWLNLTITPQQLVESLTMAGLELDSLQPIANSLSKVVVGQITQIKAHPNADKLQVCEVDVNQEKPLSIVCGAKNVAVNMKVAVALVGARVGDLKIKKAKLRGETSLGMICSASELGLTEISSGIMQLANDAPIGIDVVEYLQLDDVAVHLDITPNRGDCLSIEGLVREAAVLCDKQFKSLDVATVLPQLSKQNINVQVQQSEACPRYVGRLIEAIDCTQTTPMWIKERLRRCGIRSIDPVVDVTNYVMLELGQPLHAFDAKKISGDIHVRYAKANEKLLLLTGELVQLDESTLVIADAEHAIAIAGVIGGKDSGVSGVTQDIFLESAYFDPKIIAGKARQYGLQTDAAYRFERGVDFQLQVRAMERVTQLLLDIVGGKAGPIIEVVADKYLPKTPAIKLRQQRVSQILGVEISTVKIKNWLEKLGLELLAESSANWQVNVPSHRFDLKIEEDLIEEIGRLYGYDNIPIEMPLFNLQKVGAGENNVRVSQYRQTLLEREYSEVITYSFVDQDLQQLLIPDLTAIKLLNPISNEMNVMRTSLWPGLLKVLSYNQKRQQPRVRIFETGVRFILEKGEIIQQTMLAGLTNGSYLAEQWGEKERSVDFFDVKADIESLLDLTNNAQQFHFESTQHAALHSGKAAKITNNGKLVGIVGVLSPGLSDKLQILHETVMFELFLNELQSANIPKFAKLSKYPAIRRDIAIWVDNNLPAAAVLACIEQYAGPELIKVQLFDVYTGDSGSDKKSLACSLILQHQTRTLHDAEVNVLMQQVVDALQQQCAAVLRD